MSERFNENASARALAGLYRVFARDADSVAAEWRDVFRRLDAEARSWLESLDGVKAAAAPVTGVAVDVAEEARRAALDSVRALMLIRAYRVRGHLEADLDPLGLARREAHPELQAESYGFGQQDLERPIFLHGVLGLETATLREILQVVRRDYCGTMGLEFMHLQDPHAKAWIQMRMEGVMQRTRLKREARIEILERLTAAETFERFLDRKYTGTKRFGLEGCESALPALETMLQRGAELEVDEVVIGMAHRGRLNVLANLLQVPLEAILHEFRGGAATPDEVGGSGDVKYHLGAASRREIMGRKMQLSLVPNPSHLEAVDPVVVGRVRASQERRGDEHRCHVLGVLIHGDAAFAAQGVVAETLQLGELEGYTTGGIVHLIINNQIGFTTNPMAARSSPYPSDLAKAVQAPIVHVNGDDPEAVVQAAAFAVEYRQVFKRDVVVDLVGYRRHGHNEADEPAFTQPLMYRAIRTHRTTRELYAARLVSDGVMAQADAEALVKNWEERLERALQDSARYRPSRGDWLGGPTPKLEAAAGAAGERDGTGVELAALQEVGRALTTVPADFNLNPKIARQLKAKQKMLERAAGVDWATAEALAFGTLLIEGHGVRLSGEDSIRGTFSQRHASWFDQETEARYVPLNGIRDGQARFEVVDSPLSEFGVLGFEYGYAMEEPGVLVVWEAQFGDFANGAQVVIDQFIVAGESKWQRMNGLVLLLPHGYEGQGPEHSSARIERFLQLCAEDNMQVVHPTTPASYFHALRRQLQRAFRKPLIVMTPKSLLRHKRCVSPLEDFGPGSAFRPLLPEDASQGGPSPSRLVLCTGKVYYDLLEGRESRDSGAVHLARLEQLYPFPADELAAELERYRDCELVWCQEEPRNMGAWSFVGERIARVAERVGCRQPWPRYVGRAEAAAPATGLFSRHVERQAQLVNEALSLDAGRAGARGEA